MAESDDSSSFQSNIPNNETKKFIRQVTIPGRDIIEGIILKAAPTATFKKQYCYRLPNTGLETLPVADSDSSSLQSGENNTNKESQKSNKQLTILDLSDPEGQIVDSESEWRLPASKDNSPEKARIFSYRELATATENFKSDKDVCLGHGRYGSIFRAKVTADEVLAVRKLSSLDHQSEHKFVEQVLLLSQLYHPNLVDLIGYCAEGNDRLLVFKHMSLGSLEYNLHDDKHALDWSTRMKIAAGVARGINYLHSVTDTSFFAGDLNPSNILLDDGFNPKLSDFGLSKVCRVISSPDISTEDTSKSMYCAPECVSTGRVTSQSDTYSFGIILLEIICGDKGFVKRWAAHWHERIYAASRDAEDPKLQGEFDMLEKKMALGLAWMCIRVNAKARPLMKEVIAMMDKITGDKEQYIITVEEKQSFYQNLPKNYMGE